MTEHRATRKTWRYHWPPLGLLLVVLILGHDAVMASGALAAPHAPGAVAHHTSISSGQEDALPTHHDTAPQHPEQCSVGIVALARSADDAAETAHLPLPVALVLVTVAPVPVWDRFTAWEEPHWPPGTRRALWQVYRI